MLPRHQFQILVVVADDDVSTFRMRPPPPHVHPQLGHIKNNPPQSGSIFVAHWTFHYIMWDTNVAFVDAIVLVSFQSYHCYLALPLSHDCGRIRSWDSDNHNSRKTGK